MKTHTFFIHFRVFQGKETKQVDHNGWKAVPEFWYIEPFRL